MSKEKIILIGGGGHCKACIDVIEQENKFEIIGIVDLPKKIGQKILGYKIFASDDDIPDLIGKYNNFLITIGQIETFEPRLRIYNLLKQFHVKLPTIISPLAYVSKYAEIGEGTIIMHNALVNANASIGSNCIINSKVLIEHDAIIGSHTHISTGSIVNGQAIVENACFVGSGAIIVNGACVPEKSFIKASQLFKG